MSYYENVPVVGLRRPIPVFIAHDTENLPQGIARIVPDTRKVEVLVTIDRGENGYGSLSQDFFVCRDADSEYNWTVLWMTLNADQAQDSVQRLEPFCMLAAGWQPDDSEEEIEILIENGNLLELEGMILFWAFVHYVTKSWDENFLENEVEAGLLKRNTANLILQAGVSGKPLDFSWLG